MADTVRPGFTLVEVIVALVLLSVGALAVAASAMAASRVMTRAHHDEFVLGVVSALADSLALADAVGADETRIAGVTLTWSATTSPDSMLRTFVVSGSVEGARDSVTLTAVRVVR